MEKTYSEEDKICHDCVREKYLSNEIKKKGKRGECSFCGEITRTYTLLRMTDLVEHVILNYYERTPDEPSEWEYFKQHVDKESDYTWYREGQTVAEILVNEFEIIKDAAESIADALHTRYYDLDAAAMSEETEFDSEACYEIRGISDERWAREWFFFEETLKKEARFFSKKVSDYLKAVFDGLKNFKTWRGKPVLTTIGPGTDIDGLYRARVFQSRDKLLDALCLPDVLLGPPESIHAMNGRMNARGISVFYGADDEDVALSEVRPPVGSKVVVARFEIIRKLQVLDLRELKNVGERVSVFDPQYLEKMEKAVFLRNLAERMTAPVMPDDEVFNYLPTQAIADFLASQTKVVYDGIIYPSVQVPGEKVNIVLFHKSSRVARVEVPEGTKLEALDEDYTDDGTYVSYKVIEHVPARKKKPAIIDDSSLTSDTRQTALRVDLKTIIVNHVSSVQYQTEPHLVDRRTLKPFRIKKMDWDF